ncbi:MAG TPA: hypothetical protein VI759_00200 [Dehalococcoidia bacterium]|nr:hypothetical protein [Dehalococcoidia bacterium]
MGRYLTRQTIIAVVLWGAAAAGVLYLVAGSALGGDDDGDKQASARPTSTLTRGVSNSDAIATFTPTRVAATPAATPTAGPTKQPDRTTCAAIRGTDYRSDTERAFFIANCSSTSSSGGGGPAAPTQPTGGGGAAAPTSTPKPPTEVHHIIKNNAGTLSPDIATGWGLSDDRVVLTLTLKSGLQFPDGSPLDADALVDILNANRNAFEQPLFTFFSAVNSTTVAIRIASKITPSIYTTLAAIEIVIKTP